jgi:hypothetical protein
VIALLQYTAPRMLSPVLQKQATTTEAGQVGLSWETPNNENISLRLLAYEQVEPWESSLSYAAGENVESYGVNGKGKDSK